MQVIDKLVEQLRGSAAFNPAVQEAPAAVLWTDETRQWQSAMPLIKETIPELIELGDYCPEHRTGPAIWIKCVIAGVLDDITLPEGKTPIIYLPGVGRKALRAIEECPDYLRPLAELQYRGSWWAYNTAGRDWSLASFLTNPRVGLELDVAKDKKTQEVIPQVLRDLLESRVEDLRGKRLEAKDFQDLVFNDPIKDLLGWLNHPDSKRSQWDDSKWQLFCGACISQFGYEPTSDKYTDMLAALLTAEGAWQEVWQRFVDTAHNQPGLISALRQITPVDLAADVSHYPSENEKEEQRLAKSLAGLKDLELSQVRTQIVALYREHQEREVWLWYGLGQSRYLEILAQLVKVAELTQQSFTHQSPTEMAELYQQTYWQADAAAVQAMALAKEPGQQELVAEVLGLIYSPWLNQVAKNFQSLVAGKGYPGDTEIKQATAKYHAKGMVVFFVDGLRFDCAKVLEQKLAERKLRVELKTQWSALPSLTDTAKAAVTPVASLLSGDIDSQDFKPSMAASGSDFSSYHFKKALEQQGWQYLEGLDTGEADGLAWLQTGDLDNLGHQQQRKLPLGINDVLEEVADKVRHLLDAGWRHIRIVTDHGWLWVPDKLPKAELEKPLVRKYLSRCAILKDSASTGLPQVGWHWNPSVSIAMAPGISAFTAGDYYNHGGLSLQECLTPVLEVVKG
ncbi:BREX-1 system phosphatase PglZ type B [Shewanella algae]|uniref:BREX-1 system phosphatase PglZ type B n=1 Tax=Shewanella algae TaxID=38313 RepID=UPI000C3487AD|nr:BREX-1 system phosphatase PglZ type B [Shewanella algae]MBO2628127.1 BREX-1 system phosphatase PglZ type B [Shewanella algae]MBO2640772.1 BREX-1 system phosphatase PglZ type B [Shewanella algae]MCE9774004.1 BREX-1 system phosphatase PglZ type B [Shewanella algae]QTE96353.1 BREX-1 system phosphatase PglZ type B [Shewanella algae]UZD59965.1 BREX-1 system phosphatase PglZ type B [Shewanella algae]